MESIFSILSAVLDHRKGNHLVYPLDYILLVSFTALMSGYNTFQKAFTDWITAVFELAGQHICIDGKTMRGVIKLDPNSESHIVTAYFSCLKVALNEVFVSKKSNEINAI